MRWAAYISVIAGFGLMVAPFATGYDGLSTVALTEAIIVGGIDCRVWAVGCAEQDRAGVRRRGADAPGRVVLCGALCARLPRH